jgi:hypothetical protein
VVFDYESAWSDLLHFLASDPRPNFSARQVRDQMGLILDRRRVNEAALPGLLRLHGVQLDTHLQVQPDDASPTPPAIGHAGATVSDDRPQTMTPGGAHDGSRERDRGSDRGGARASRAAA